MSPSFCTMIVSSAFSIGLNSPPAEHSEQAAVDVKVAKANNEPSLPTSSCPEILDEASRRHRLGHPRCSARDRIGRRVIAHVDELKGVRCGSCQRTSNVPSAR